MSDDARPVVLASENRLTRASDDYGFRWGQLAVQRYITRTTKRGTDRLLAVVTEHHELQIAVSPKGHSIRVWLDHVPLVPFGADQ